MNIRRISRSVVIGVPLVGARRLRRPRRGADARALPAIR